MSCNNLKVAFFRKKTLHNIHLKVSNAKQKNIVTKITKIPENCQLSTSRPAFSPWPDEWHVCYYHCYTSRVVTECNGNKSFFSLNFSYYSLVKYFVSSLTQKKILEEKFRCIHATLSCLTQPAVTCLKLTTETLEQ